MQTRKIPTPFRTMILLAAGLLLPLVGTGCVAVVAAGAGAGTVAYIRGELASTESAGYETTVQAANRAVERLGFAKIDQKKDALTATLTARTAQDKKIEIRVIAGGERSTQVKIRVGLFGDEQLSLRILNEIRAGL